jgi:hypothetical protein
MRSLAWLALAALAAAGGCRAGGPRRDDARLEKVERERARTHAVAHELASVFSEEGSALAEAARARRDDAALAAKGRIEDAQTALDGLEEAEHSFQMARSYYEAWGDLALSSADRARVDATVARMVLGAQQVVDDAVGLVQASRRRDATALAQYKKDLDYDRLVLKAYRNDLAITARLGPESAAEHAEPAPARPPNPAPPGSAASPRKS